MKIKGIKIRKILNSIGTDAYEAEICLDNGTIGTASSSLAILAGRKEKKATDSHYNDRIIDELKKTDSTQKTLDLFLEKFMDELGTDIALAISLAYARAAAAVLNVSLVNYIRKEGGFPYSDRQISPMVPIFSGGIHAPDMGGSMQQIMLLISNIDFGNAIYVARDIYCKIEQILLSNNQYKGLAASSGFLVNNYSIEEEFDILTEIINKSDYKDNLSIAIDVAAEHLWREGMYKFYNKKYMPDEFEKLLYKYIEKYPIKIVEDPFDSLHINQWYSLRKKINGKVKILSDDYTATQTQYLDADISDGLIVKMKQVGTLTSTLKTINEAQARGMRTCVSHRSCETEDTFMCDLAVASNADYMKIGGPRRGDRVEKYNRLIRLYDVNL